VMGGSLAVGQIVFKKNLLKALIGEQLQLPEPVWQKLTYAWCGFFGFMGLLNLYVAYHYSTDAWVDFKLFGGIGLMVLFTLAQGLYLSKHMHDGESPVKLPVNKR
jgi:intracellular septation protein